MNEEIWIEEEYQKNKDKKLLRDLFLASIRKYLEEEDPQEKHIELSYL